MKDFDFPTRKDWGRTIFSSLYILLIAVILVSGLYRISQLSPENQTPRTNAAQSAPTFTSLVIQPLTQSDKAIIIFEHLFYLLIVLACFILLPIPMDRMKRFRLLNFEVEMDGNTQEVVKNISIQQDKFGFLTHWLREENKIKFLMIEKDNDSYKDFLQEMLTEMKNHYLTNWNTYMDFEVLTEQQFQEAGFRIPSSVKKALPAAKIHGIGLPINKENDKYIHLKNYLIYPVSVTENLYTDAEAHVNYIVVLTSHKTIFDEYDGQLVSGLSSLTADLYQRYHTLLAIEENAVDFEEDYE